MNYWKVSCLINQIMPHQDHRWPTTRNDTAAPHHISNYFPPFFSRIDESKLNLASEKTAILSSPRGQLCLACIFHGSVCCKVKLTNSLVKNEISRFSKLKQVLLNYLSRTGKAIDITWSKSCPFEKFHTKNCAYPSRTCLVII
jgi:hypothetical protein